MTNMTAVASVPVTAYPSHPQWCRRARPALDTIVEIAATGPEATPAVEAAFSAVMSVHHLMSFDETQSDVSRINAASAGEEVLISRHTHRVLRFARRLGEASDGVFDITRASVFDHHGASVPAGREATWTDLDLLAGNCVCWRKVGRIDLDGIA